jgi:uncharacterized protein with HEPN domain
MDMLDAIAVIHRDRPVTREQFDAEAPLRSHILLHALIIGEAASKVSSAVRDQNPQVPWKPIMRMRNVIAHVYFGIDWDQVWEVAVRDVASLKPQIEAVIATLPPDMQP